MTPFHRYVELLIKLVESDCSDDEYDAMDEAWNAMTEEELKLIEGLGRVIRK